MTRTKASRRVRLSLLTTAAVAVLAAAPFAAAASASASTGASAGAATGTVSAQDTKINQQILGYQAAHPDDLAGLDKLVFHFTGRHIAVRGNGMPKTLDGVQAQPYLDAARQADARIDAKAGGRKLPVAASGGIPAYSVNVTAVPLMGPPSMMRITGSWQFPDAWAGQDPPVDEASLGFTSLPTCVHQIGYAVNTYTYNMKSTNLGYLENANIANSAPIWAIKDGESGFVAQAGRGNVALTLENFCGRQQYGVTFQYDANQGGSVVSVSAGFGFLTVSYNSPGLTRNEGTAPLYFTV